ncbi:MAG TPA: VOC family protein [Patescibacteria group bacterium]|nr:VOC family protein [Patescibacteria group bacterium]
MLGDKNAVATIAVKDMEKAKDFYENTLGLSAKEAEDVGGIMYTCGSTSIFVYKSEYAGSNKATSACWGAADDFESIVSGLQGKGVKFEEYDDLPGVNREGAIHTMGDLKAAWFKDPDGNILNIVNKSY